ncbi:MAG: hypothetical protein OXN95_05825 [bacterium]|nr:hypothetical protein [bacterium]
MRLLPPRSTLTKRALGILTAVTLLTAILTLAPSVQAQNQNLPPIADAGPDKAVPVGVGVITSLDGTRSFDIERQPLTFSWSVVTTSYSWLIITPTGSPQGSTATFFTPSAAEVARYGSSITFRLTVTDFDGLSASDTVVISFETAPSASIDVAAFLPNPNARDTDGNGIIDADERYTIPAILGRPNQGGNSDIEWDIREGARLTLTGTGSTAQGTTNLVYRWRKLSAVPNRPEFNLPGSQINRQEVSLILPDDLQAGQGAIIHYGFIVTGTSGIQTEAIVRINVVDQPFDPEVELDILNTGQPVQDANALDPDAETLRYVIAPGVTTRLIARASDGDRNQERTLSHTWSGTGVTAGQGTGTSSQAAFTAPATAPQGQSFTVTVDVVDSTSRSGRDQAIFVVATNTPPVAAAPEDLVAEDGPRGGTNNQGLVILTGSGSDADGDLLAYRWVQVDSNGDPLEEPTVELVNADEATVAFAPNQLAPDGLEEIHLAFTVADQWGVGDTDTVTVFVLGKDEPPVADAGLDLVVEPNTLVRLDGTGSYDPDPGDRISSWSWAYIELNTTPPLSERAPTRFDELDLAGFIPRGPNLSDYSGLNPFSVGANTGRPVFIAPELGGYTSVQLTFQLTVTDTSRLANTDTVTVTVTGRFFSGTIDGPEFCTNHSLGGPLTYAFDRDRDGVADICSLPYTRREAVARQNALETRASLNEANFRAQVRAACNRLSGNYGDSATDLAADACATGLVSPPPPPVSPTLAQMFFSGVIDGPDFCTNLSLGGPRTYAFDSDRDGVADVCSLPYTRREAVARQNALETFTTPEAAFDSALAFACRALGSASFEGDSAADLALDACA